MSGNKSKNIEKNDTSTYAGDGGLDFNGRALCTTCDVVDLNVDILDRQIIELQ